MKRIAIYVEGGGDTAQQRTDFRVGFDQLLFVQKGEAQRKRLQWKSVPSGSRNSTYEAFKFAARHADDSTLCVMLVDSEDSVPAETKGKPEVNAQVRKHIS